MRTAQRTISIEVVARSVGCAVLDGRFDVKQINKIVHDSEYWFFCVRFESLPLNEESMLRCMGAEWEINEDTKAFVELHDPIKENVRLRTVTASRTNELQIKWKSRNHMTNVTTRKWNANEKRSKTSSVRWRSGRSHDHNHHHALSAMCAPRNINLLFIDWRVSLSFHIIFQIYICIKTFNDKRKKRMRIPYQQFASAIIINSIFLYLYSFIEFDWGSAMLTLKRFWFYPLNWCGTTHRRGYQFADNMFIRSANAGIVSILLL